MVYGSQPTCPDITRANHVRVALGGREVQRIGEAAFAEVHAAAVDVGMIEEVDAGTAGDVIQFTDLRIILVIDAHHSCDDGGGCGGSEGDGLHTPTLVRSGREPRDRYVERLRDAMTTDGWRQAIRSLFTVYTPDIISAVQRPIAILSGTLDRVGGDLDRLNGALFQHRMARELRARGALVEEGGLDWGAPSIEACSQARRREGSGQRFLPEPLGEVRNVFTRLEQQPHAEPPHIAIDDVRSVV